jgi:uncharacterized membrane protein YkgB
MRNTHKIHLIKSAHRTEERILGWMDRNYASAIRISIGIIFFWFGMLKFFSGISPAEGLAIKTIDFLSFGLFSDKFIIYGLASLETLIGLSLIFKWFLKATLIVLFLQMLGTMTPLILFPDEAFTKIPYALTLEGQYIVKNLAIISGAFAIGASLYQKSKKSTH